MDIAGLAERYADAKAFEARIGGTSSTVALMAAQMLRERIRDLETLVDDHHRIPGAEWQDVGVRCPICMAAGEEPLAESILPPVKGAPVLLGPARCHGHLGDGGTSIEACGMPLVWTGIDWYDSWHTTVGGPVVPHGTPPHNDHGAEHDLM